MLRGFVPRAAPTRTGWVDLGWSSSLTGPWGRSWRVVTGVWGVLDTPQRRALVKLARRGLKRKGTLTVGVHPGRARTGRPLGTRMGKGKGKPTGEGRTWLGRGRTFLVGSGPRGGLTTLGGRSSLGLTLVDRGW